MYHFTFRFLSYLETIEHEKVFRDLDWQPNVNLVNMPTLHNLGKTLMSQLDKKLTHAWVSEYISKEAQNTFFWFVL